MSQKHTFAFGKLEAVGYQEDSVQAYLFETARQRWRRLNSSELLPLVRAGVTFRNGTQVERDDQTPEEQPAEIAA